HCSAAEPRARHSRLFAVFVDDDATSLFPGQSLPIESFEILLHFIGEAEAFDCADLGKAAPANGEVGRLLHHEQGTGTSRLTGETSQIGSPVPIHPAGGRASTSP